MTMPPSGQWPPPPQVPPPHYWGPPQPPPKGGNKAKWLLGGLGILLVVVLSVAATLIFTREDSSMPKEPAPSGTSTAVSNVASADDSGPVAIITSDPTCASWSPIGDAVAAEASKGWSERDASVPAEAWTPSQRAQYESMAKAMTNAAMQTVPLARLTPHRVMRELYEQSIAYWRGYANSIRSNETNDALGRIATGASNSLTWICSAIESGAASARAPLVPPSPAPLDIPKAEDPEHSSPYVTTPPTVCGEWISEVDSFNAETIDWQQADSNIPASQWSANQQEIFVRVSPIMSANAARLQDIGLRSDNTVFDDIAALAAQYRRGFVQSIPTYTPSDSYLARAAGQLVATNYEACKAGQ